MEKPVVSVICVCYNHKRFIIQALESVLGQTYPNIELIIIDDFSSDGSRDVISDFVHKHPEMQYRFSETNLGICKAFNTGWRLSKGEYLIDLSADDILYPARIEEGLKTFEQHDHTYGINFTDAEYVDEENNFIKSHYRRDMKGRLRKKIHEGNLYPKLLSEYFICAPTMMTRRNVLEALDGYDETLTYEDFDFWIRSSKKFKYCYTDKILVKKRGVKDSLSGKQYTKNSSFLKSTLEVCKKAEILNENEEDRKALLRRIRYEFRQAMISGNKETAVEFLEMMQRNDLVRAELFIYKLWLKFSGRA
jgi:glycosyltransferase involved in cell wall biosynthesis